MTLHSFIVTSLALFAALAGESLALDLVKDGQAASAIVIPKDWLQWQKLAAEELQYHFRKMSGATVPVFTEDKVEEKPGQALILVGQGERVTALGVDTAKMRPASYAMKVSGNTLILAGEDGTQVDRLRKPRAEGLPPPFFFYGVRLGSLYAVYDLLDKQFGCRWVFPGEIGEVIPKRTTISVPDDLNVTRGPDLAQRFFRPATTTQWHLKAYKAFLPKFPGLEKAFPKAERDEALWMLRMRMGRNYYFESSHEYTGWWKQYGQTLPEIFALQPDGSRGCQKGGNPQYVKMCVTNPKLWDLLIAKYQTQLAADAVNKGLCVAEDDGDEGFCVCPKCQAWDLVEGTGKPQMDGKHVILSERYARFYNEMARRVRKVDPAGFVIGYAYSWYQPAPQNVTMEPNVVIAFSEFSVYPHKPNHYAMEWVDRWSRGGARIILRSNALWYQVPSVPYVTAHQMAGDLARMVEGRKLYGTDLDTMTGCWAAYGPLYYVLARKQWDTTADCGALFSEYYDAFGPMGPVVREYFDYWEQFTTAKYLDNPEAAEIDTKYGTMNGHFFISASRFYTPEVLARGRAILDKATPLPAGATPDQAERFRNIELGLEHAALTLKAYVPLENPDRAALLKAARELMDFREKIVGRNVVNVYAVTNQENGRRRTLATELPGPEPSAADAAGKRP